MAKKKSRKSQFTLKPWCWYCEREFEDEKVLLQHQKAKHFKCRHCPRKLNTAGGLMVHCQQVHKTEPDKLENTLPGRDGYEIEIFGMEGVPAKDQAEWKAKKEAEWGVNSSAHQQANAPKRPRIYHGVIGEDELRVALETHRVLMSGGRLPGHQPGVAGIPPPGLAGAPPPFPPAMPPFPMAGGFPPHPPPPGQLPFPPNLPPPGFRPPFMPPPGGQAMPPMPPFAPPFAMPPPAQSPLVTESATIEVLPPKDGVVWPDPENMPAEKRSLQQRYRYASPAPTSG